MRIRSIDWMRGLVMAVMAVDHAGSVFDAAHMHGDSARGWVPGSPLPAGEFLTRWVTHVCAPAFVLLAGASLALSEDKRRDQPGQTRFLLTRGLLIAALDPAWMSLAFTRYEKLVFQVLFAIGASMVCMAGLRRLSSRSLVAAALVIQAFGELSARWSPAAPASRAVWALLFVGGPVYGRLVCGYPLLPWLSIMMLGCALGRWLLATPGRSDRARALALAGAAALGVFAVVRGADGYGNWRLYRDSLAPLQWLHVAKYPPSLAFCALELGLALLLLSAFMALDEPAEPRKALAPLALLGTTAFFFYLLHMHLMVGAQAILELDRATHGLAKTWLAAAIDVAVLLLPCAWYRPYRAAHPNGWARYI